MFVKLVEAITTGRFQDVSFKDLAGLEFLMFNIVRAGLGAIASRDGRWEQMEAESQKRFNVPRYAEIQKHLTRREREAL